MKHKLSILMIAAAFFTVFSAISSFADPFVTLNLLDSKIIVGETFGVEVWGDGDDIGNELLAFGFDVAINDGSYFSYDSYVIESGFDDDSFGLNNVAGSTFPGISNDNVLLATLSFTAIAEGTDTLTALGLYDGGFSGLYYEDLGGPVGFDINASLDITVEPVPEPGTMILVATGLIGLAGFSKRFRKR